MTTVKRTRRERPGKTSEQETAGNASRRVGLAYLDINEIKNYEYNPRDNAAAIKSVAASIKSFGFAIPVVVDADNVLIAGHTRVAAAKSLGLTEVPVIQVAYLSEQEAQAFRVIDNKVAELAKWDFDLLSGELNKLQGSGLVLTDFGWTQEELDCLTDVVADDCLNIDGLVDVESRERIRRAERRAPATARFVLGEVVFFLPATEYREWVNGLRTLCDYNETEIIAEVKRRLGMSPAV
jgi:hypothetical protein